jgi:hypothetical protein
MYLDTKLNDHLTFYLVTNGEKYIISIEVSTVQWAHG